jgi:hypothetical protein
MLASAALVGRRGDNMAGVGKLMEHFVRAQRAWGEAARFRYMDDRKAISLLICLCLIGVGVVGCPDSRESKGVDPVEAQTAVPMATPATADPGDAAGSATAPTAPTAPTTTPTATPMVSPTALPTATPSALPTISPTASPAGAAVKPAPVEPDLTRAAPTTFGLQPGQILPKDVQIEGAADIIRHPGGLAAYWPRAAAPDPESPPQRLFVFTDDNDRITGIQWDRPGQSMIGPEELVLDFIVPDESFDEPPTPEPHRLRVGESIENAVTANDDGVLNDALRAQVEAESILDKRSLQGPLVAGIVASGMDDDVSEENLAAMRSPENVAEYAFYFVGTLPGEPFFSLEHGRWTRDLELNRARSGWHAGVIMAAFTFYDMTGITQTGFDRTILQHDFVAPRETRIRNLGDRRIRIDAHVLSPASTEDSSESEAADDAASEADASSDTQ